MKSKLIRYPFSDGKRFRWDTKKMGKQFQYGWQKSLPNNYSTITPYIEGQTLSQTKASNSNNEFIYNNFDGQAQNLKQQYFTYNGGGQEVTSQNVTNSSSTGKANALGKQTTTDLWDPIRLCKAHVGISDPITDYWYGYGDVVVDGYQVHIDINQKYYYHIRVEKPIDDLTRGTTGAFTDIEDQDQLYYEVIAGNRPEWDRLYFRQSQRNYDGEPADLDRLPSLHFGELVNDGP